MRLADEKNEIVNHRGGLRPQNLLSLATYHRHKQSLYRNRPPSWRYSGDRLRDALVPLEDHEDRAPWWLVLNDSRLSRAGLAVVTRRPTVDERGDLVRLRVENASCGWNEICLNDSWPSSRLGIPRRFVKRG